MGSNGDGHRKERVVKNEAAFRQHNERRAGAEAEVLSAEETLVLVCECGDAHCTHGLEVSVADYEQAREREDQFIVLPGHVFPEYERVVSRQSGHSVVRKF